MEGELLGTIRSWREPWGFIVCPSAFQGDLFAHREHFIGPVPPGDLTGMSVQFERKTDIKGRAHAANIQVLGAGAPGARWNVAGGGSYQNGASTGSGGGQRPRQVGKGGAPPIVPMMMALPSTSTTRASPAQLEHFVDKRLRGEIRSWRGDWGFIVCPTKFAGDVFVHRQSLQIEGDPVPGTQVSFTVTIDQKGRAAAAEVTAPRPAPEDYVGKGALTGQVRSWKREWGFITAPDYFEGDLFCHVESLQIEGAPPDKDKVEQLVVKRTASFEVELDKRGRARAVSVALGDYPEGAGPPAGLSPGGVQAGFPEEAAGEVLQGTFRSWRDPWGFIVCPEKFEGDLFAHKECFTEPAPPGDLTGRSVQFVRAVDAKGRAHAKQVQVLPATPAQLQEAAMLAELKSGQGAEGRAPAALDPRFAVLAGLDLIGKVKSWRNEWGFLVSPENFEGDVFAHKENLADGIEFLTPNASVSFQVAADAKGRTTARQVKVLSEAKEWAGRDEVLQGMIRSFKPEQPWGFVVSPGSFTGDLFFHVDSFGARLPKAAVQPGMQVAFRVQLDKNGRCHATDMYPSATMSAVVPSFGGAGVVGRPMRGPTGGVKVPMVLAPQMVPPAKRMRY